jgi:hypothetical protein
MKRLIAAVSFAVFAVPALAAEAGLPYEQNAIDRTLPNVSKRAIDIATPSAFGVPYEQNRVDRALPHIEEHRTEPSAASGDTRAARTFGSPWANDYNFIAPAP